MSWDQKVFSIFYDWWIKSKNSILTSNPSLELHLVRRQCEVFLSALCERNIEIRDSSGYGGFQGPILFLPEKIHFFTSLELNYLYLEWRLLAASLDYQNKGISRNEIGVELVIQSFPKLKTAFEILKNSLDKNIKISNHDFWFGESNWKKSKIELDNAETIKEKNGFENKSDSSGEESASKGTEKHGKTKDKAKIVKINSENENPLVHVFEKVLTAEDYQGGQRKIDGNDELEMHSKALDELNLSSVIRTQQSTQSVLKTNAVIELGDVDENTDQLSLREKVYYYPEWFSDRNQYKKNWCSVYESKVKESRSILEYNKKTTDQLNQKIYSILNSYKWITRQKEGSEIDINLALDRYVKMITGEGQLPENVYRRKIKNHHDFSIQILVDSSLSADSYSNGRRIIETTQEALNIFTHAFRSVTDQISLASFSSHTRNRVNYQIIKEFDEDWSLIPNRISSLKPEGYTRIGPAIRHSRYRLEQVKSKKKLLLFISDAKPTDYDYYEGQHGIDDIQRAVVELQNSLCQIKVLTLTDQKHSHHNYVFGTKHCRILKNVEELSESLFDFWHQSLR